MSAPRWDITVTVDGVKMQPFQGFTSSAAFTGGGAKAVVMGDLTLTEDQVSPVMDAALDNGLEVTALHNHVSFDRPRVLFMHIAGTREPLLHGERAANRALCVVRLRHRGPEVRHQPIAEILVERAAEGEDRIDHRLVVVVQEGDDLLAVQEFRERREVPQVAEEQAHLAALADRSVAGRRRQHHGHLGREVAGESLPAAVLLRHVGHQTGDAPDDVDAASGRQGTAYKYAVAELHPGCSVLPSPF